MDQILTFCPELPHHKTSTGTMIQLSPDLEMHIPDDYKSPEPTGFFERIQTDTKMLEAVYNTSKDGIEPSTEELYRILSEDMSKIKEFAYDVGVLHNITELLIHELNRKIVKFETQLSGLLCGDMISDKTKYNIFLLSDLDTEVTIGGEQIHVTANELLPVSSSANCYMDTRIQGKNTHMVTCYAMARELERKFANDLVTVGRFDFRGGLTNIRN